MGNNPLPVACVANFWSTRPWVAGIAPGRDGAYSVCLSGGYEDDVDEGYALSVSLIFHDPITPDTRQPTVHIPVQVEGTSREPKLRPRTYVVCRTDLQAMYNTENPAHS